jgi:hypothetical protein
MVNVSGIWPVVVRMRWQKLPSGESGKEKDLVRQNMGYTWDLLTFQTAAEVRQMLLSLCSLVQFQPGQSGFGTIFGCMRRLSHVGSRRVLRVDRKVQL